MTLTNNSCTTITISSTLLDEFISTPANFTKIVIKGALACGAETSYTYNTSDVIPTCSTTSAPVRQCSGVEYIYPDFFSATTFADGIYGVTVTAYYTSGSVVDDKTCIFVDCTTKCAVVDAEYEAMVYHYVLTNSANCDCSCTKLCEIYDLMLAFINAESTGCTTCK